MLLLRHFTPTPFWREYPCMTDFPITPAALTAEWLSEALGFPVQAFEVTRFAEGTGIIAMVTRVLLTTAAGNPRSVIAKFPTPNPTNRSIARTYNMYAREVMFYRSIADKVEIRAPHCYYAAIDPATDDFVVLLEDLRPSAARRPGGRLHTRRGAIGTLRGGGFACQHLAGDPVPRPDFPQQSGPARRNDQCFQCGLAGGERQVSRADTAQCPGRRRDDAGTR